MTDPTKWRVAFEGYEPDNHYAWAVFEDSIKIAGGLTEATAKRFASSERMRAALADTLSVLDRLHKTAGRVKCPVSPEDELCEDPICQARGCLVDKTERGQAVLAETEEG